MLLQPKPGQRPLPAAEEVLVPGLEHPSFDAQVQAVALMEGDEAVGGPGL